MGSPQNKNNLTVYVHVANGPPPAARGGVAAGGTHTVIAHRRNSTAPRGLTGEPDALRTWKIASERLGVCTVLDYGGRVEVEREGDGAVVWTGRATETGFATTGAPKLATAELQDVLHLMLRGEQATFGGHAAPTSTKKKPTEVQSQAPAAGSAKRAQKSKPKPASKHATASSVAVKKTAAKKPTEVKPQAPEAGREKSAEKSQPKSAVKRAAASKATANKKATPAQPQPPAASSEKRAEKPKSKAAPKKPKVSAPPAIQSRPSQRSKEAPPPTERSSRSVVSDARVMEDLQKHLAEKYPAEDAETLFKQLEHIWRAGGRDKTLAWMAEHGHAGSIVEAFESWFTANQAEAQDLLKRRVA